MLFDQAAFRTQLHTMRQALYTSGSPPRCRGGKECSWQLLVDKGVMYRYPSHTGLIDEQRDRPAFEAWIREHQIAMRVEAVHGIFGSSSDKRVLETVSETVLPLAGFYGVDYRFYFEKDGQPDPDRPSMLSEDFLFVKQVLPTEETVRKHVLSPAEILGYYQWEWGFLWDWQAGQPADFASWCRNDGLANGSLHRNDDVARQPWEGRSGEYPCRYAHEVHWWHQQSMLQMQMFVGEGAFSEFMLLEGER